MNAPVQLSFFENPKKVVEQKKSQWGTFKDSLKAPVHRWFTYPAGFSYRAVEYSIRRFHIEPGQTIYDPFMGSGTTNLVAKTRGLCSIGVEAHPFVYKIACTKLNWSIEYSDVQAFVQFVEQELPKSVTSLKRYPLEEEFPELILKCYERSTIYDLWGLRELLQTHDMSPDLRRFFFVVVTALLREVSTAATGWPYIAPNKKKVTSFDKDVLTEFRNLALSMAHDINKIKAMSDSKHGLSEHLLINGDARCTEKEIAPSSADHVFTSPPYLNNFDYADRTRLELYFWGLAKSWGEITSKVRTKLITSATTQVNRRDPKYKISSDFLQVCPEPAQFICDAVSELSIKRKKKSGKKSYDLMVAGYFNDIYQVIKDVYRVLKPGTHALFVLGDSAPYGVHIPTDKLIGQIALGVGFDHFEIEVLRTRGGKWKKNPQRHSVPLREAIVILRKSG